MLASIVQHLACWLGRHEWESRGGSFGTLGLGVRSASRFFSPPDARNPDVGARIARVVNAD